MSDTTTETTEVAPSNTAFSRALKRLLDGRTLAWLSSQTGIDYSVVQRIANRQQPDFEQMLAIAGALKVPLDAFARFASVEEKRE